MSKSTTTKQTDAVSKVLAKALAPKATAKAAKPAAKQTTKPAAKTTAKVRPHKYEHSDVPQRCGKCGAARNTKVHRYERTAA